MNVSINRGDMRISLFFIYLFFINLLMLFVMLLCLKTHSRRWKVLSFKIKVESLLNGRTRPVTPISRKQTAVHFSLCNQICGPVLHGRKQQPTTGFMAVVSGGKLAGWMTVRGILHCPLVLWHILYFLVPAHADSFFFYCCMSLQLRRHSSKQEKRQQCI